VDAAQREPRKGDPQAVADKLSHRSQAERAKRDPFHPSRAEHILDVDVLPPRQQDADWVVLEPPEGELEQKARLRIEPLDVVDRNQER